jgi:hypothetical protein
MEKLTLEQLTEIAQERQNPSFSIFMPTYRAGPETRQNPIRFKNLLRQAEQLLLDNGRGQGEADEFLQSAHDLLNNGPFWQHQEEGLAVFIASDDFHVYRLPFPVEELLVTDRSYYVKPILPLFTNNGLYYILAISQNDIRLFEGTRHSINQIDLPKETPTNLEEALQFDDPEKQLSHRTGTSQGGIGRSGGTRGGDGRQAGTGTQGGIGTRGAVFHGQGDEEHKTRIERYFNLVDHGLKEFFREKRAPLVLAGVEYLLPIYHQVSEYANIMEAGVTGNPEGLRPEELQEQAWPLVEPYFRQQLENVVAQYHELVGTGTATDNLEEVVAAAFYGRVESLLVATDSQVWGQFDPDTGKVVHYHDEKKQEDDISLSDFAATKTLETGGAIYALPQAEMPTDAPILAVFRYSI